MDNEFYYVSIWEKSKWTGIYPFDFILKILKNEEEVMKEIKDTYAGLKPNSWSIFWCREYEPFLITNNPIYYRQYRNVFNDE